MCGIFGYVGEKRAIDVLLCGLGQLEYRGYDSAGVSLIEDGRICVDKKKGRLESLCISIAEKRYESRIGIGHTRWATHGEPSDINSHPHISKNSIVSIVHNGIIENYQQIKGFLRKKGFDFVSETDSEVIAHLIEYYYDGDIVDSVRKTVSRLKGSYAIAVLCKYQKEHLVVAKRDSPLVIGLGDNERCVSSDIQAMYGYIKKVIILEDNDIALISGTSVNIYDITGNSIDRKIINIELDNEKADKQGFEHYMLKEIYDEPGSAHSCISQRIVDGRVVIPGINFTDRYINELKKVFIIACGTAYHAAVAGKYTYEKLLRLNVEVDYASEFRYRDPLIDKNDLVIIISQSGETIDSLFALREAKRKGANILSIVNVAGSSITRESDSVVYTYAGPEIAVASTKAYNNQLLSLYLIGIYFAKIRAAVSDIEYTALVKELLKIPSSINSILKQANKIKGIASSVLEMNKVFFIGRGLDFALSMEGSLKLKEVSYIYSEAYAGGELKHGPLALIEQGTLVICSLTQDELFDKMRSNMLEVKARGAFVIAITAKCDKYLCETADLIIKVPEITPMFLPAVSITVMQLFAYYMAVLKGNDVDKPRNLAKSVTVE